MIKNPFFNYEEECIQDYSYRSKPQRLKVLEKKMMVLLAVIIVFTGVCFIFATLVNKNASGLVNSKSDEPSIRIALPPQSPFPILLGESRVFEVLFYSGHDDRTAKDYRSVTEREVIWTAQPKQVATVDAYGRLETHSAGTVTVRVQLKINAQVYTERTIKVIQNTPNYEPLQKRIVNYEGGAADLNPVRQKIVTFYTNGQAIKEKTIPQAIKIIIRNPKIPKKTKIVQQEGSVWTIVEYADKSGRTYITRQNDNEIDPRDRLMHLIGNRYLPGDGLSVLSIQGDRKGGLWTVNEQGVSHIIMENYSYKEKAKLMVENTKKFVMRHGLAADSSFINGKWVPSISENDGLWTGMFAAGELMRYSTLKRNHYSDAQIAEARLSALRSLKAVLLIANIPMRNATIDAKIRHYINTRAGSGQELSEQFLKEGRHFAVDTYVGSAADGQGFFGIDAGKTVDNTFYGGEFRYSFEPINTDDWTNVTTDRAATTKRTLNGYMARTFVVQSVDGVPSGGLTFRHNQDGSQYVVDGAERLYDFNQDDNPTLDLGKRDLPQILKDFLIKEVGAYNRSDLIYKGDTSTDEVIGHLFLYKIAFDILNDEDLQEKKIKELISSTMVNFCTCLTNNDYTMVDATGQGTTWAKLTRTFITSDFTLEDAPLKSLQLLMAFKLCNYVTGDPRWQKEYEFLIEDPSFRYLDVVASVWRRWTYRAFYEDASPTHGVFHLNPNTTYSEVEVTRHILACVHYSDQEEAFLAYYLAFQLQDKQQYLSKYREGLEGWWHSVSRSQNPLWYYIYQLAYPNQEKKDHYGNLLTETASWQLSRHPVSTLKTAAFVEGSRNDVMLQGKDKPSTLSTDPHKIIGKRIHQSDQEYFDRPINHQAIEGYDPSNIYEIKVLPADERSIHKFNGATFDGPDRSSPESMEAATVYTLPYWMGVYHNMLKLQ